MGLNIPPDAMQPPPANGDIQMPKEHEFDIMENEVFGGLATWGGIVGIILIVLGVLQCVGGLLSLASIQGMITIGMGVCFLLMGGWTWSASRSFRQIVTTEGNDITLLMHALRKLRSMFTMWGVLLILYCVLLIAIIMLMFSAFGHSTAETRTYY